MAAPIPMPLWGHNTAPYLNLNVPRELQWYFEDLELLFIPALIGSDIEKKI
jgi:hypothetical protein